jgi:hypothetical protein
MGWFGKAKFTRERPEMIEKSRKAADDLLRICGEGNSDNVTYHRTGRVIKKLYDLGGGCLVRDMIAELRERRETPKIRAAFAYIDGWYSDQCGFSGEPQDI